MAGKMRPFVCEVKRVTLPRVKGDNRVVERREGGRGGGRNRVAAVIS